MKSLNYLKKLTILFLCSFLILSGFQGIEAEASTPSDEIQITTKDGRVLSFPSEQDYQNYLKTERASLKEGNVYTPQVLSFQKKKTLVSSERKNMLFVGYSKLTPDWSKAAYYDINKGSKVKIGGSYKYKGVSVNIGFSKSYGVTTRIYANKNKWSKLAGYADITFKRYRVDVYESGQKLYSYYETTKTTHNTYIKVKYK